LPSPLGISGVYCHLESPYWEKWQPNDNIAVTNSTRNSNIRINNIYKLNSVLQ